MAWLSPIQRKETSTDNNARGLAPQAKELSLVGDGQGEVKLIPVDLRRSKHARPNIPGVVQRLGRLEVELTRPGFPRKNDAIVGANDGE